MKHIRHDNDNERLKYIFHSQNEYMVLQNVKCSFVFHKSISGPFQIQTS